MSSTIDLDRARDLFRKNWGSRFLMTRNGVVEEYGTFAVPAGVEMEWMEELRTEKLATLEREGNWLVVEFLNHHRQAGYLDWLLSVPPAGSFWQQCAYLEALVEYWQDTERSEGIAGYRVGRYLDIYIADLAAKAWSPESTMRVEAIRDLAARIGR